MMPALIRRVAARRGPPSRPRRCSRWSGSPSGWSTARASSPAASSSASPSRARSASSRALLLADEPTGNLDPGTADGIHALLAELNARLGITAVVVTHNERLASALPRRLRLDAGQLVGARGQRPFELFGSSV